jgi:hypothetical protein
MKGFRKHHYQSFYIPQTLCVYKKEEEKNERKKYVFMMQRFNQGLNFIFLLLYALGNA